ncbi:MAG: sigma-70 family RNA polymerase sigma factor [Candidatus Cloacimonadota bacterium]|nr:sigma-70 family RNA polymerase sigma factor [Candidatus Cloacimonadota bacterium]
MNRNDLEKKLEENYKKIFYLALKMLKNQEDAEDATQEILFLAFENAGKFRGDAKFSTWLYRIALNHIYAVIGKRKKMKDFTAKDLRTETKQNPESALLEQELFNKLNLIIDDLPNRQKEVFLMRYYNNLKFKEIATILKRSIGTIKSNYFFAMQTIKEKLSQNDLLDFGGQS